MSIWPHIIRPRRSRSAAADSDQTFPCTICRSVGLSSALWKNGGSDPDAVWDHRSDGSRDEVDNGVWQSVHGKGYFWGRNWGAPLQPLGTYFRSDAALFPYHFGQTRWHNLSRCYFGVTQQHRVILLLRELFSSVYIITEYSVCGRRA